MNIKSAFLILLLLLSGGCQNNSGMQLAPGWGYHSLSAWKDITPNKMVISPSGDWLYIAGERSEYSAQAGVIAIRLSSSRSQILVQGMRNANGISYAPDGSLWMAEDDPKGGVWRMAEPDRFPPEQLVDPIELSSSHIALAVFHSAGQFNHRAMAFSADGHFAYMADAQAGSLYRLELSTRILSVFHRQQGWLMVDPDTAVADARKLGAAEFASIHDIERLPDGTLLMAESGSGHLLELHDDGKLPHVDLWLKNEQLTHPGDMAWDQERRWLWITDQGEHASVWAWDGRTLHEIISHPVSRFSGVVVAAADVYVNIQRGRNNPSMTLRLHEKHLED
ncbi:MAG: hypothetical protein R8K50_03445 [Mariprofundus sp.]